MREQDAYERRAATSRLGDPTPIHVRRGIVTAVGTGVCNVEIGGVIIEDVVTLAHVSASVDDEVRVEVDGTDLCVVGVY